MKIIKFEFEKVLKNKIVIGSLVISFIVLLGIFFVGYNYSQFKMSERNNVNKGFPKNIDTIISRKYAGDFTDKKVQMILSDSMNQFQENEEKGVTDKPFYLFYWQMGDNFFDDDSENIYTEMIQKVKSGERLLLDDVSVHSIRDLGFTEFEKPLQIGNYVPWTDFFSVIGNINLLICVLTILICSTIFSNDTSKNVNQILLITKLGRNKMIFAKIIVGTVIPLCTLILFHLLNAGIFSLMYDTSGWNSSIQTNLSMGLFQFPVEWNHLQTYLIVVLLQSIGIVFVSSFTLLISSFAKSPITSLSVSLGMFLLPQLLLQIFRKGILNKLLYFFPINNLNAQKTLELLSSEKSFLMSSFIQNLMVVFLFLITLKIIFDFITYRHMKSWHFS